MLSSINNFYTKNTCRVLLSTRDLQHFTLVWVLIYYHPTAARKNVPPR